MSLVDSCKKHLSKSMYDLDINIFLKLVVSIAELLQDVFLPAFVVDRSFHLIQEAFEWPQF